MRRLWVLRAKLSWPGPDAPALAGLDADWIVAHAAAAPVAGSPAFLVGNLPPASGWIRFLPAWPSCRCRAKGDAAAQLLAAAVDHGEDGACPKVKRGAIMNRSIASPIFE